MLLALALLVTLACAQSPSSVQVIFGDNIPSAVQNRVSALVAK
jgi:hypothetical protein